MAKGSAETSTHQVHGWRGFPLQNGLDGSHMIHRNPSIDPVLVGTFVLEYIARVFPPDFAFTHGFLSYGGYTIVRPLICLYTPLNLYDTYARLYPCNMIGILLLSL